LNISFKGALKALFPEKKGVSDRNFEVNEQKRELNNLFRPEIGL
jgi:hypothetical protein